MKKCLIAHNSSKMTVLGRDSAEILEQIRQRLDVLIFLQLRQREIAEKTTGEQMVLLKRLGLQNVDIAQLLGTTTSYVSSELVRQKSKRKEND